VAGLIFAPIIERSLMTMLAGFFSVPLTLLCGAFCWQLLPAGWRSRYAAWRFPIIAAVAMPTGCVVASMAAVPMERLLFHGDVVAWLDGRGGSGFGGWVLALLPLVAAKAISAEKITVNALSGVSGAGRSLKQANLFPEVAEAVHPYSIGAHRHMPEMEQELSSRAGRAVTISFTPHLVPMNRGELVTCIVETPHGPDYLRDVLADAYTDEPFVHLLPAGVAPATRMVRGSNHVVMNVFADRVSGRAIVIAAIDNLVKGSSGQAIQNFNLMFGLPETMGLEQAPLFP
jgi:hypothetical protein